MASTDPSLLARIFSPGPTRDDHPASGATGKAGRNLTQAITTAVVLIAAVAVPLFTSLSAFVGVIGFVCLIGIWELAGAFARMGITLAVTPLYVGAIGMVTCAWWLGSEGMLFALYITVEIARSAPCVAHERCRFDDVHRRVRAFLGFVCRADAGCVA